MEKEQHSIRTYFAKLGLEPEIADIYLALHTYGPQSISSLSRSAKVERTRIYRLIDRLLESNLIEVETRTKRGIIKAAPISNLRILLAEREQELKSLQDNLELIEQTLTRNTISNPATRVQFYHGPEGIRQMQWNLFRAKSVICSVMHSPMQSGTGSKFFERWSYEWNRSGKQIKLLYNQHFAERSTAWHVRYPGFHVRNHESRLLEPSVYAIHAASDIYDDVVAYYNWVGKDIYGVEIYNQDIAANQRTFFDMIWQKAQPQPVTESIDEKEYA